MSNETDRLVIPSGEVIDGFEIIDLIGVGGIYKVKYQQSDEIFAMKTEDINSNRHTIPTEISILKTLHYDYFPKYIFLYD